MTLTAENTSSGRRQRGRRLILAGLIVNPILNLLHWLPFFNVSDRVEGPTSVNSLWISGVYSISWTLILWIFAYRGFAWARMLIGVIFSFRIIKISAMLFGVILTVHVDQTRRLNLPVVLLWAVEIIAIGWSLWLVGFSRSVAAFFRSNHHH